MKQFYKKYRTDIKILVIACIVVVGLVWIGNSMLVHDDFWYPFKNTQTSFATILASTDLKKAQIHLQNSKDLNQDFTRIMKQNSADERLLVIGKEMGIEEGLAIKHMEAAKKANINVSPEVEKLCDQLQIQQSQFQFLVMVSNPKLQGDLQKNLNVTNQDLMKALDW